MSTIRVRILQPDHLSIHDTMRSFWYKVDNSKGKQHATKLARDFHEALIRNGEL